jgi:hypothetical protein
MSAALAAETPLAYERRVRPRFALMALLAGVLLIAVVVIQTTGPQAKVAERTLQLIVDSKRGTQDVIGAIATAIDALAISGALYFLVGAVKRRNPDVVSFIGPLCLIAGGLTAVATIIATIASVDEAHQFVKSGAQTYQQAHNLNSSGLLTIVQILGLLGAMLLSVALILVSLQAMRVGLLTRLMGYVGMLAAVVILMPTLVIVETLWFIALALLILGRWPTGNPPAWESGRAEPWPSSQQLREERIRAAGGKGGSPPRGSGQAGRPANALPGRWGRARGVAQVIEPAPPVPPAAGKPSPATAKRKRKRRR